MKAEPCKHAPASETKPAMVSDSQGMLSRGLPLLPQLTLSLVAIILPLVLYRFRHLDDNSLTSWDWVFTASDPALIFVFWFFFVVALFFLARVFPRLSAEPPLWLVPALAFLLCTLFFPLPEVLVDASRYILQAKSLSEYGLIYFFREWGREIFIWTDLPMLPLLYGLLFSLLGESRLLIQLLNALFFSGSALVVVLFARNLWGITLGLKAGLIFLSFPYLYSQAPLVLVDIGSMFFFILAVFSFHRALSTSGWGYLLLSGFSVVALVFSKYSLWVLLSTLPLIFGLEFLRRKNETGFKPHVFLSRGLAGFLPAIFFSGVVFYLYRDVAIEQFKLLFSFQAPLLASWSESLLSTFFFQTHPLVSLTLLAGGGLAIKRRDISFFYIIWPLVLLIVLLDIRRIRYMIPLFPFIAIAAAYGLQALPWPRLRQYLVLLVFFAAMFISLFVFSPFLKGMSEKNLLLVADRLGKMGDGAVRVLVVASKDPVLDSRVSIPILGLLSSRDICYDQARVEPKPADYLSSSLRFSWELHFPPFYREACAKPIEHLLLVGQDYPFRPDPALAAELVGWERSWVSLIDNGVFWYRTMVEVYSPLTD